MRAEGFTCLTHGIAETSPGVSRLTVTHDPNGAPGLAHRLGGGLEDMGAGGWARVLSDL